jgi:hypothetical protein
MKESVLDVKVLERECSVFCRYLIGKEPNDYVQRKYREAHRSPPLAHIDYSNPSDSFLVKLARISPWNTKLIESYARVFHQSSLVRKKLILLLAILESCAPTDSYLDSVDSTFIPLFFLRSLQRCLTFALLVVLATLVILPLELAVRSGAKLIVVWSLRHG